MKYLIVMFALILLIVACYGIRAVFLLQKSKELVQNTKSFEKVGDADSSKFLFVGDSTGVGMGSAHSRETLAGFFSADFPDYSITNLSQSGRRTKEALPILQAQADQNFDWVFVQIGGNDILQFTPKIELGTQIRQVLSEAKRVGTYTVLITSGNVGIAPFFPRLIGGLWTRKTLEVRGIFMEAAQSEGFIYVDLFQYRQDDLFLTDISRFYSEDLLHPAGAGYLHWYKQTRKAIRNRGLESHL